MATIRKTAEKQVNAMRRIEEASAAIAKNLGIEIASLPNTKKFDAEFGKGLRLEHWASVFEQIAEATGKGKPKKVEPVEKAEDVEAVEPLETDVEIYEKPEPEADESPADAEIEAEPESELVAETEPTATQKPKRGK